MTTVIMQKVEKTWTNTSIIAFEKRKKHFKTMGYVRSNRSQKYWYIAYFYLSLSMNTTLAEYTVYAFKNC